MLEDNIMQNKNVRMYFQAVYVVLLINLVAVQCRRYDCESISNELSKLMVDFRFDYTNFKPDARDPKAEIICKSINLDSCCSNKLIQSYSASVQQIITKGAFNRISQTITRLEHIDETIKEWKLSNEFLLIYFYKCLLSTMVNLPESMISSLNLTLLQIFYQNGNISINNYMNLLAIHLNSSLPLSCVDEGSASSRELTTSRTILSKLWNLTDAIFQLSNTVKGIISEFSEIGILKHECLKGITLMHLCGLCQNQQDHICPSYCKNIMRSCFYLHWHSTYDLSVRLNEIRNKFNDHKYFRQIKQSQFSQVELINGFVIDVFTEISELIANSTDQYTPCSGKYGFLIHIEDSILSKNIRCSKIDPLLLDGTRKSGMINVINEMDKTTSWSFIKNLVNTITDEVNSLNVDMIDIIDGHCDLFPIAVNDSNCRYGFRIGSYKSDIFHPSNSTLNKSEINLAATENERAKFKQNIHDKFTLIKQWIFSTSAYSYNDESYQLQLSKYINRYNQQKNHKYNLATTVQFIDIDVHDWFQDNASYNTTSKSTDMLAVMDRDPIIKQDVNISDFRSSAESTVRYSSFKTLMVLIVLIFTNMT